MDSLVSGTLYLVATPIGNLEDMTPRAIRVLGEVAFIAAEDTRHAQRLMSAFTIGTKLISYHDHNEEQQTAYIIKQLISGSDVALVSDAGVPLISDPGYVLVHQCHLKNIRVVTIPGPCALISALSCSGLATDEFHFYGFLPSKTAARAAQLKRALAASSTGIFYESPKRILHSLHAIQTLDPERNLALAKELTKLYETVIMGTAEHLLSFLTADPAHQKGEFVLLVAGVDKRETRSISPAAEQLLSLLARELPLRKASSIVAEHYQLKVNELYQWGLEYLVKPN